MTPNDTNQIQLNEGFQFAHEIVKPFGDIERVIDWCRTELQGEWRWQMLDTLQDHGLRARHIFYFDSERDCVAFLLHWG